MKTNPCECCHGTGVQVDQRELGDSLRQKREAAHISLRSMAADLGISAPYLSDLERGHRHWSPALRARFEKALHA